MNPASLMGELFVRKPDGSVEKLCDGNMEPIELSLAEDNGEADRIFELWKDPIEFSFTANINPVERFRFETKMMGGAYWVGKVPRRRIKNGLYV